MAILQNNSIRLEWEAIVIDRGGTGSDDYAVVVAVGLLMVAEGGGDAEALERMAWNSRNRSNPNKMWMKVDLDHNN